MLPPRGEDGRRRKGSIIANGTIAPPEVATRRPGGRPGRALVLAVAAVAVLLAVRIVSPESLPLPDIASDFLSLAISVFVESLPFIVLGVLLSVVVRIWLPPGFLERMLPKRAVPRRMALSLLGVLLPVCECGNVPLARGLLMRGFTVAEALTFLLAAPLINPVTIITTYQAFGFDDGILVGRIAVVFVLANLVGLLVSLHPRQEELLVPAFQESCARSVAQPARGDRPRRSALALAEESGAILPALVIGSAVAALIQVVVSRDVLVSLGGDPLLSVLALMGLAFVVAICSNVDAFFILPFASTFLPGGIVAFLTFGAMVDVKMLALLRTTFTGSALLRIALVVGLGCLVAGLGINALA